MKMKVPVATVLRCWSVTSTCMVQMVPPSFLGRMKILGLVIANALVALCGAVVCHEQRSFSSTMGTGQMVFGLATVIIGTTLFRRMSFVKGTTCAVCGSIIYKICIQVAISLGLPANLLKLVTAVLFLVILILGNANRGKVKKHA